MDCNKNEIDDIKRDIETMSIPVETNNNFESNKETSSSGGGDLESVPSDGTKISESREDRFKRLKEKSEAERLRKYSEILESQRLANESRQKQQEERRKKIEDIKQREDERKKKVEQRRHEMDAKEKERNESFMRRTKEREARARVIQRHVKTVPIMTQSVMSANHIRMTSSSHSNDNGSVPDKCKKVYQRSASGCDVQRISHNISQAAGNKAVNVKYMTCPGTKRPEVPDGFIEVSGHLVPGNTRHVGCFVPYRGPEYRVKGVLAWRPPSESRGDGFGSWWAGLGYEHRRASSAHAALLGTAGRYRKDMVSSSRIRSSSRSKTSTPSSNRISTYSKSTGDQTLFDRLSKPRGTSQPPKSRNTESVYSPQKKLSSSLFRSSSKAARKSVTVPTNVVDKRSAQKRKSLPISAPDSGITSSPASELESAVEFKDREEVQNITIETVTEELALSKTSPKKITKNLQNKDHDDPEEGDIAAQSKSAIAAKEEEIYRLKLLEQRRLAREAKERNLEEQRKLEQEAKESAMIEKRRIEEETRQIMEEETKRLRLLAEEEEALQEKQRAEEESERNKKEELEREMEEKRMEKSRSDDTDRMERKRRLEKIMSRVKKVDESSSQSNEESAVGITEFLDSSILEERRGSDVPAELSSEDNLIRNLESNIVPIKAWTIEKKHSMNRPLPDPEECADLADEDPRSDYASPCLLSDNVLDLPGPETNSCCVSQYQLMASIDNGTDQIPVTQKFKSPLLQSLMAKTRLATSNSDVRSDNPSITSNKTASDDAVEGINRQILNRSHNNNHLENTDFVLHSRSCDNVMDRDQSRNSLSYESQLNYSSLSHSKHHSDTENEVTVSSLASNTEGPFIEPPSPVPDHLLSVVID